MADRTLDGHPVYRCIFFDLDGTLTDSKAGIINAVQYALEKEGLAPFDEGRIIEHIGGPLRQVICEHYGMDADAAARLITHFRDYYGRIGIFENRLFPGVKEMLERLQRQGRSLAVATAKPTHSAHRVLEIFGLADFFGAVAGSDGAAGRRTKSEILGHGLDLLGGGADGAAVMVGDRRYDIEAARSHGIDSVGLSYGYGTVDELKAAGATRLADSVPALESLLLADGEQAGPPLVRRPRRG